MEMVEGYEIQKAVLFETGHGFALGCSPGNPDRFAVWTFTETAFGRDYYKKSILSSRESAEEVFRVRAGRYREIYGMAEKTGDGAEYYRYYSTQRPVDIATYPEPDGNRLVVFFNYDEDRRRPVAGGRLRAWGELTYRKPLSQAEVDAYELVPAPVAGGADTMMPRKEGNLCG